MRYFCTVTQPHDRRTTMTVEADTKEQAKRSAREALNAKGAKVKATVLS